MTKLTDNQIEKIIEVLKNSSISAYEISKNTRISQATIGNYRKGRTIPTQANALILKSFFNIDFAEKNVENSENTTNSGVILHGNNSGEIDNRQYYSDSPDVLRIQIDMLNKMIEQKEHRIDELLQIIKNLSQKSDTKSE